MAGLGANTSRLLRRLASVQAWRYWLGLALFTLGLLAIAIELQIPDFWVTTNSEGEQETKVWASALAKGGALVAAVAAAISPVRGGLIGVDEDVELHRYQVRDRLEDLGQVLFSRLADSPDGPGWKELTVRLYCVDRSEKEPVLRRVAEARHHYRQTSGVVWTKGKGSVGLAWERSLPVTINLDRRSRSAALASPQAWANADPEMTQGMSWDEAKKVQSQGYGSVAAHPVRWGRDVIGVISIDCSPGHYEFLRSSSEVSEAIGLQILLARDDIYALWESYRF